MAEPSGAQDVINRIFTGGWREVSIGIYLGIGAALWGYIWSYRSTERPRVVTATKQQIPLTPVGVREAEAVAKPGPALARHGNGNYPMSRQPALREGLWRGPDHAQGALRARLLQL